MDKMQFKKFCKEEFQRYGFRKNKKYYYLVGDQVLCGMDLQKSNYGSIYYVNFFYCIGNYKNAKEFPTYYEGDIVGRIHAMSKSLTDEGEQFITSMIEYEEYTECELRPFFEREFAKKVLPPVYQGKSYILDNLNGLYHLTLNKEAVLRKLRA